jgi:6-phosphogluconate dehydrogenase
MLDLYREILEENRAGINLLDSEKSLNFLLDKLESIKYITSIAKDFYIPTLVLNTSLDYFFSMAEENLPANLIQAQRDFFGAHTYSRVDKEGIFHTVWE